jgi:SAM-dependent methyltransferase
MRVLDLGSGAGDVAFVAAGLVGPAGEVVGIDQSPDAVARATARAGERRLSNVRFVPGDIHDPAPDGPFDAIIGRLVLMYVPDPAAVLRTQTGVLRSGGVIAPIEIDAHSARSLPSTPLVSQALSWLREALTRAGIDPALGPRLWAVLQAAGLQPAGMIGVQPHFGPEDPDGPAILAGIVRTVLPLIERTGVATAAEVDADTLQQRLSGELAASAAVFAHPMLISAWGTARQPK